MENVAKRINKRPVKIGMMWESWYRFRRNKYALVGLGILFILFLFAIFPQYIAPYGEDEQFYEQAFTFPCREHLLGTDNFGRDLLSRVIYGTRVSMLIGISSVGMALLIGGTLGLVAAYYGGKTDNIIMRFMDILYALPSFLLAIAIASAFGAGLFKLTLAIAVGQLPGQARIVRAAALGVKGQEFMEAATAIGCNPSRVMFKHMLPNSIAPIIVHATLEIAGAILSGASLSFIGLGVQPPTAEWGYMLNAARPYIREYWYMVTFPGIMIMLTIFAFNLLGDGLRDALDPKLKM